MCPSQQKLNNSLYVSYGGRGGGEEGKYLQLDLTYGSRSTNISYTGVAASLGAV